MYRKLATGLLLVTLLSCGGGSGDGNENLPSQPNTPSTPNNPSTPSPPSNTLDVSVQDNQYTPATANITTGGTVTWTWSTGNYASHSVTFADGNGSSPTKMSGTHTRSFGTTGTYAYYCEVHGQGMSGTVVVSAP